jgi:hypothetical protein
MCRTAVLMAEFDLIEDFAWLAGGGLALLFGLSFVVAALDRRGRVNQSTLQLVLAQLLLAPLGLYTALWCYRHPERAAAQPLPFLWDARVCLACLALFEVLVIVYFVRLRRSRGARALRLMKRAHRLLAEGKVGEADAVYAEGRRLLDRDGRRN